MVALSITGKMTTQAQVAQMTWDEWQAFIREIEECTCRPDGDACPTCTQEIEEYYDDIPFKFGGSNG